MNHLERQVPEAHRTTQIAGLRVGERVGIVDPVTKKPVRGSWASVTSISGTEINIRYCDADEMVSDIVFLDNLYSIIIVGLLYDGISSEEIIATRRWKCRVK